MTVDKDSIEPNSEHLSVTSVLLELISVFSQTGSTTIAGKVIMACMCWHCITPWAVSIQVVLLCCIKWFTAFITRD